MLSSRMRTVRSSSRISGGCTWSGGYLVQGVPGLGGVPGPGGCTWSQGVYLVPGGVPGLGVYLVPGGVPGLGVPGPGGVYLVWGVYLVLGGVPGLGGYLIRYSPPYGQTRTCKNITFATSLRTVKIFRFTFDGGRYVHLCSNSAVVFKHSSHHRRIQNPVLLNFSKIKACNGIFLTLGIDIYKSTFFTATCRKLQ